MFEVTIKHSGLGTFLESNVKVMRPGGPLEMAATARYDALIDQHFVAESFAGIPAIAAFAAMRAKGAGVRAGLIEAPAMAEEDLTEESVYQQMRAVRQQILERVSDDLELIARFTVVKSAFADIRMAAKAAECGQASQARPDATIDA